jgi:hypothetical protein
VVGAICAPTLGRAAARQGPSDEGRMRCRDFSSTIGTAICSSSTTPAGERMLRIVASSRDHDRMNLEFEIHPIIGVGGLSSLFLPIGARGAIDRKAGDAAAR